MIECEKCGCEIDINESRLLFRGIAHVKGFSTLLDFHDNGIIWDAEDSCDEECQCPKCEHWFSPDMIEVRTLQ